MSGRIGAAVAVAVAAAVVAPLLCDAERALASGGSGAVAEATRRFRQGNQFYGKGQYEQALRLYLAAYELLPSPDILFNIGLAKEKVLDYEGCALAFRDYIAAASDKDPALDRARERFESCRSRARIAVRVSSIPAGAAISLGSGQLPGEASFRGRTPAELVLPPGDYTIGVQLPGYLPLEQTAKIDIGQRPEIDFPLEKLASLTIEADVAGASVQIGTQAPQTAPMRRELRAGLYQIRVFKPRHRDVVREIRIGPGEQSTLMVSLPRLPALRSLRIEANVSARVSIDGEPAGSTPIRRRALTGLHRVTVRAPDHQPYTDNVRVSENRNLLLQVQLEPNRSAFERRVLWGLGAAAGAAAAGASIYGVLALSDQSTYDDSPSAALADRGDQRAQRADYLWGASATLALSAVIWHYLTRPDPSSAEAR